MLEKDLFGNEYREPIKPTHGKYKKYRARFNYRESEFKDKRCKTCNHVEGYEGNTKTYYKCKLQGASNSEASDIKLKNICNNWERDNSEI